MEPRDPLNMFGRTYERSDNEGLLDYVIVIVATVVAVVAAMALYGFGSSAALGLPTWADATAFLTAVAVVWIAGLQATAWLLGRR